MIDTSQIPGYGIDADFSRRPGVPKEKNPPEPLPNAVIPPKQISDVKQFTHGRPGKSYPPVYGTAQPPAGLSGRVRALAYRYPDHVLRHWLLLLVADRVDVWEHRLGGVGGLAALAAVGVVGGVAMRALARRRRGFDHGTAVVPT